MGSKFRKGVTIVELIMVIMIIGILSVPGTHMMFQLIKNSVFVPNKLNMDMLASDALDIIVDGDSQAKGLRFSRSVISIQDYQIVFNNQDNQAISYRLDTAAQKLYRSISGGAEKVIPYYAAPTGINMLGKNNKVFVFYDAAEAVTADPAAVRRIEITLVTQTGSGSYDNWQGASEQITSVAVKKYQ